MRASVGPRRAVIGKGWYKPQNSNGLYATIEKRRAQKKVTAIREDKSNECYFWAGFCFQNWWGHI